MTVDLPTAHDGNGDTAPRVLIVGAGARGLAYAKAIHEAGEGIVAAVAEPIDSKRANLGRRYIWGAQGSAQQGQSFDDWESFVQSEVLLRKTAPPSIDAVIICVLDEHHEQVILALAPLNLHILCEKPLSTSLRSCLDIYTAVRPSPSTPPTTLFGIGHVLRYSPHNMLLRRLVLDDKVVGDILSLEHTEPIGQRHFSHSYVRGSWRREDTTAPTLLTKSCHDIDWLLWMMTRGEAPGNKHMPARVTSSGSLKYFRRLRKPAEAGDATNCLSCPIVDTCTYSAKRIYFDEHLAKGNTGWPCDIVVPDIEAIYDSSGPEAAKTALWERLAEDWSSETPDATIRSRPWFGRCVWDADNDVVDDQYVTLDWDDTDQGYSKTASFHMIAHTEAQCRRRGRIYGSKGEISYDGKSIEVFDFNTRTTTTHDPGKIEINASGQDGHGGGDAGLAGQFVKALVAVKQGMQVESAQEQFLGCTIEEVVRSHAIVFAAEQARTGHSVVQLERWWKENVGQILSLT